MTAAATPPEEINLAPKAVVDTDDDDDTEIDNDELTSLNGHNNTNDTINNIPVIQRQTSKSPINNIGDHSSSSNGSLSGGIAGPVGGSADTRRRITKLSKAREREKVPRLVEYFCVVSSSSDNNNNNYNTAAAVNNSSNNNGGGGWTGAKVSGVNSVRVLNAQPCDNVHYYFGGKNDDSDDNNNTRTSSLNNTNNNNNAAPPKLDGSEFQPKITARYPPLDHEENPLLSDSIIAFCYPSGKLPIYGTGGNNDDGDDGIGATAGDNVNNGNVNGNNMGHDADGNPHKESEPLPKVHYFVTTGESGQKMYGTCLTVWERHLVTTTATVNAAAAVGDAGESKKKNVMDNPIYDKRDFDEKKNKHNNQPTYIY